MTSRVEKQWSDYLDNHIGTEYLISSDRSMRAVGGCQLYRPDKLYASPGLVIIAECDEHQHFYNNGSYLCDERRISDLFDEFGGTKVVVIRWNPHAYANGNEKQKSRAERLEAMVEVFRAAQSSPPDDPIHVYYMFYDVDNPRISKNLPKTMLW